MWFVEEFLRTFSRYLLEIFPYFMLALLFVSLLENSRFFTKVAHFLRGRDALAVLSSILIAGMMPLCSCSMLPVAMMINSISRSYSPVVAFMMVAPVVSPISLAFTYSLFGLKALIFRSLGVIIFALLASFTIGSLFRKKEQFSIPINPPIQSNGLLKLFLTNLRTVGRTMLLGILIVSVAETLLPDDLLTGFSKLPFSYMFISVLATPVYVCSGEDAFIAKFLTSLGLTHGNALSFMLAGSGVCLPTVLSALSFLPKKLVLLYSVCVFFMAVVLGFLYDVS
ncbi:permease [Thermocrinis minervae]|uniref:Permease n=1 Tax=Thermocrinis minervae TaxID=381751 RepID=A0A1M6SPL0_9AQUI|nr:permease [Thermocrinis minervae]SHK46625.1 hypothetical protein SAMN05444391_1112 [Thermocrinis minervae]